MHRTSPPHAARSRAVRALAPCVLAAVVTLALASPARAGVMQAYTHGFFSAAVVTNNIMTGYRFVPQEDIIVTRLGVSIPLAPVNQPDIIVGLWSESGQAFLASTTVVGGAVLPIEGGSRFADIDPVQIDAGAGYRIAMYIPLGPDGYYNLNHPRMENPLIEFGPRYVHQNAGGLAYPQFNPADLRVSGPNFQFIIVPAPGAAACVALLALLAPPTRRR